MRGAGRNIDIAVRNPGGDELFLMFLQTFRIFQRRFRAETHEEDLDLLVEFRRLGHGAAVDRLEVELCWRCRRCGAGSSFASGEAGSKSRGGATAEQADVREFVEVSHSDGCSLHASHGKTRHSPVIFVGQRTEISIDPWD